MRNLALFVVCVVAAVVNGQKSAFVRDVTIVNDPLSLNAVLTGKYFYYHGNNNERHRRIDYTGYGLTEVINYTNGVRYKNCASNCTAYYFKGVFDILYPDSTYYQSTGQVDSDGCTVYTPKNLTYDIAELHANGNVPCTAIWRNGRVAKWTGSYPNAVLTDFSSPITRCTNVVCKAIIDFALVLDDSGSISDTNWSTMIKALQSFIALLTISTEEVQMSISIFSYASASYSYIRQYLTGDRTVVNSGLTGIVRKKGNTCIGCGLNYGLITLQQSPLRRAAAKKMMMTFTDGVNNDSPSGSAATYLNQMAAAVHAANVTSYAVGIGGYNLAQLNLIASTIPGVTTVFTVSNFNVLITIMDQLVRESCGSVVNENGGDCSGNCRGFCGCHDMCQCPTCYTADDNACFSTTCTAPADGSRSLGCVTRASVTCPEPTDRCKMSICDNATGSCPISDRPPPVSVSCVKYDCDPDFGFSKPMFFNSLCDAGRCSDATCTLQGCNNAPLPCNPIDKCHTAVCDNDWGCQQTYKCPHSSDPCKIESCDGNGNCLAGSELEKCKSANPCVIMSCHDGDCFETPRVCINSGCFGICNPSAPTGTDPCTYPPGRCCSSAELAACPTEPCKETACYIEAGSPKCTLTWDDFGTPFEPCKIYTCNAAGTGYDVTDEVIPPPSSAPNTCSSYKCMNEPNNGFSWKWRWVDSCEQLSSLDACFPFECSNETAGKCTPQPYGIFYCPAGEPAPGGIHGSCMQYDGGCEDIAGVPKCTVQPRQCASMLPCATTDGCFPDSGNPDGTCVYTSALDCDGGNRCMKYKCDPSRESGQECVEEMKYPVVDDPCVYWDCDPAVGDRGDLKEVCVSDDPCILVKCNIEGECIFYDKLCVVPAKYVACYSAECRSATGACGVNVNREAFFDQCGQCIDVSLISTEETGSIDEGASYVPTLNITMYEEQCVSAMAWPKLGAAIAGGVIAAIVVAGLIGLAIALVSGYYARKEFLRRSAAAKNQTAVSNPLYEKDGTEAHNPLYDGEGL